MESKNSKIILDQEKKIKTYEQKMRDLIEAYKGVVKEKETLERAVESFSKQKVVLGSGENISETDKLQDQLSTLSVSLASLTEERRRMERTFLEDKRVMRAEYEGNLKSVRAELETQHMTTEKLRRRLEENEDTIKRMEEDLRERENELIVMKEESGRMKTANMLMEEEMALERVGHESRVSKLEEMIADISRSMGLMEKQHLMDMDHISKLSDRVETLVTESRCQLTTTRSRDGASDTPDILQFQDLDQGDVVKSVKSIVDRILRLKTQLEDLEPNSADITNLISTHLPSCMGGCEDTITHLKEQLECTQLKLESAQWTQSSATYSSYHQQEVDRLNQELLSTRSKVAELQEEMTSMDTFSSQKEQTLKETIARIERNQKHEIARLRQEHLQVISDMQSELTKHRNRTINLLSEKDIEIHSLQRIVQNKGYQQESTDVPSSHAMTDSPDMTTSFTKFDSSCPLYQCCEAKARMDQELRRLRHEKRQLQMSIHKLEADSEYSKSDLGNEIRSLTDRLNQAESLGKLSSTINMEYLRNVFLRFLTTSDSSCKYLMAKAIGKVLQISPKDLKCLEKTFLP